MLNVQVTQIRQLSPKIPKNFTKTQTSAGRVLASVFWDPQAILFIDYLAKGRTINSKYYIALFVRLIEEIAPQNAYKWRKMCSFTKTMHRITSHSQPWQNYINCTLNCFCTHPIFQMWPPATTGCLQTSKECSRERNLAPMKNDIGNWGVFWSQKQIVLTKKHRIVREALESVLLP